MTTPDMKPGLNFGKGPGAPNPFRATFFILGFVFIILGITSNPVFFGSGIIFVILGFSLKDGDGKGPDGSSGRHPKDDDGWSRDQMDQSDSDGNPRPSPGSENS